MILRVYVYSTKKYGAHKMFIKSNYVMQKTFINFYKRQFKTNQTKTQKMTKKTFKKHFSFGLKNSKLFHLKIRPSQQLHRSNHLKDY